MRFNIDGRTAPHTLTATSVDAVMRELMLGLLPGTAMCAWFFGWGVLSNLLLALLCAIGFEALALRLRGRRPLAELSDCSAAVTAWLLALALPPMSPWWLIAVALGFAILLAKHAYGGLGYNPFNPAMVGYVVVLIAFPREMTAWLSAGSGAIVLGFVDTFTVALGGPLPGALSWDALTQATPLDAAKTEIARGRPLHDIALAPLFGAPTDSISGDSAWQWLSLAWLAGGAWLLYRRVISWHIPLGLLLSLLLLAGVFHLIDDQRYADPLFHLLGGATMLGAFFIATDPVTAASSDAGRFVYAIGIGALTYIIRTWGGYPDGIAFAVLLANMCAPTIDYYFRPRTFGHHR